MKTLFLVAIFILPLGKAYNQTSGSFTKEDYLKKSKNQKTVAWVMAIGGTVTTTIGIAVALSGGLDCSTVNPNCGKNQTLADILLITGGAAMLGSVPLFIAASKNKKKAMSLSMSGQPAPWIIKTNLALRTVPSITLKIGL